MLTLPSSLMAQAALRVIHRLQAAGHQALLAGGCVRDMLLGREPHDFDVATSARPEEVQTLFPRTVAVGAHFGVILVLEQGQEIQVATFRADGVYQDGRRPASVTFTDAAGDASRRDFTINGLFFDPVTGTVLDFVGGQEDLQRRVLRAIGHPAERFQEDRLRLLRAVRFAAVLDFAIDPATWSALTAMASDLHGVSAERIRDELNKTLISAGRLRGFDLLEASGLLARILPEIEALKGCEQPPEFHPEGDVFTHTRLMLSLLPPNASLTLVWGVLLHDIGKPATAQRDETGRWRFHGHERVSVEMALLLLQRLRFSNQEIHDILELIRHHMSFKDVQNMRPAKLRRFLARPTMADELELHRVDCLSSHGMCENWEFLRTKQEELAREPLIPPPLLTGHDLIALGLRPGPLFKEILEQVQTLQLEGTLTEHSAALAWVRENYLRG